MTSIFTDYIRSLKPGGPAPEAERFEQIWEHLRTKLAIEMKRRGVWYSSPSYLGIYGYSSWAQTIAERSAFDELTAECYAFIFLDRLRGLKAQAQVRANIDGLILRNIRNFLFDTQKRHDPLGFRVFEVVQSTVRTLVEQLRLYVLEGPPKVRNETILGFTPSARPARAWEIRLAGHVESWNDELLPDLVTGRGKALASVKAILGERLCELLDRGFEVFRFKDLVDALKADVRVRWESFYRQIPDAPIVQDDPVTGMEKVDWVRLAAQTLPGDDLAARGRFEDLTSCVETSLDRLETRRRTRDYLHRLWIFLRAFAAESRDTEDGVQGENTREANDEKLPSHRKLGELLDIPRERMPGLYAKLGGLIEDCRAKPGITPPSGAPGFGATTTWRAGAMDTVSRQDRLRQATAKALADLPEPVPRKEEMPRIGELYVVAATSQMEIEWAVIDVDSEARRCLVVPADLHPLAGNRDLRIGREGRSGALTLRCGFGVWVEAGKLEPDLRTGMLNEEQAEQARNLHEQHPHEQALGSISEDEDSPELEDWTVETLVPARDSLVSQEPAHSRAHLTSRRERRAGRRRVPTALAASFVVVAMGLSWSTVRMHVRDLERPLIDVPGFEVAFLAQGRAEDVLRIPGEATHFTLTLLLHRAEIHPRYVLTIADPDGQELWSSKPLERTLTAEHVVTFPRRLLPNGDYLLRLYGEVQGEPTLLDERKLRLISEAKP